MLFEKNSIIENQEETISKVNNRETHFEALASSLQEENLNDVDISEVDEEGHLSEY